MTSNGTARECNGGHRQNVGGGERLASAASGGILALLGLGRRDATGMVIAGIGGALVLRGATGYCPMYASLGVDTSASADIVVRESLLVNRSPEEIYAFWRNFENLPSFMSHLESVEQIDERRSHWVAKAPSIIGGEVEWDAEITADEPNGRIAWQTVPESEIEHRGSVRFVRVLGDRGTSVRVELQYKSPAGKAGQLLAKLFGEEPEMQIHDDLRKLRQIMEIGEVLTIEGQPHGRCGGIGALLVD